MRRYILKSLLAIVNLTTFAIEDKLLFLHSSIFFNTSILSLNFKNENFSGYIDFTLFYLSNIKETIFL